VRKNVVIFALKIKTKQEPHHLKCKPQMRLLKSKMNILRCKNIYKNKQNNDKAESISERYETKVNK